MTNRPFVVMKLAAIIFIIMSASAANYYFLYNYKKSESLLENNIDQFILVKKYIKHCVYDISNSILSEKKQQALSRKTVKEIDEDINLLCKQVCKALSNFIRKDYVIESLHKNYHNEYFLFPDTLLKKYKLTYYADLLSICSNITGSNIDIEKTEHNCKLYISSIL